MIQCSSIKQTSRGKGKQCPLCVFAEAPLLASLPVSWPSSAGTCYQPLWECHHHFHWLERGCFCRSRSTHSSSELLFSGSFFYMPLRCSHRIEHVNSCITLKKSRKKKKNYFKGFTSSETGSERSRNISVTTET